MHGGGERARQEQGCEAAVALAGDDAHVYRRAYAGHFRGNSWACAILNSYSFSDEATHRCGRTCTGQIPLLLLLYSNHNEDSSVRGGECVVRFDNV